jgi:hypothetical protein
MGSSCKGRKRLLLSGGLNKLKGGKSKPTDPSKRDNA